MVHVYVYVFFKTLSFIKQTFLYLKEEVISNTVMAENCNSFINGQIVQTKFKKETLELNYTIYLVQQIVPTDIYRTFYSTGPEYISFSLAHRIFSRIYYVWEHKTSLMN